MRLDGDWEDCELNEVYYWATRLDGNVSSGVSGTKYFHTDHLGTTRSMTVGSTGAPASGWGTSATPQPSVYTAFGERIAGPSDGAGNRYGYVGAYGYQSHDSAEMPFLHLGARYYDPSSGRFLQRDPIGVFGGRNVYEYASNTPSIATDPDGLIPMDGTSSYDKWAQHAATPGGFLDHTGGHGRTPLDRWGDRVGNRPGIIPSRNSGTPGFSSGAGTAAAGRYIPSRPKVGSYGGNAAKSSSIWRTMLHRSGYRAAGRATSFLGGCAAGIGAFIDSYMLLDEAIYAYYDIPPGVY